MANSVRSPEVITSIIFGIFASVLGVFQIALFLVHRKHRRDSIHVGECTDAYTKCRADRPTTASSEHLESSKCQSLRRIPILIQSVVVFARYEFVPHPFSRHWPLLTARLVSTSSRPGPTRRPPQSGTSILFRLLFRPVSKSVEGTRAVATPRESVQEKFSTQAEKLRGKQMDVTQLGIQGLLKQHGAME